MSMEFILGARVSCSDGTCGEVTRTIFDPATRAVTHLVVEPKHRRADGRLVPVGLVEAAAGEVRLRCDLAEFGRLDPSEEVKPATDLDYGAYGPASVAGYGDVGSGGVGASSSGMGIGMGLGHEPPIVISEVVPDGESEAARHEAVHAADGKIGQLKGFAVDPATHTVTHILLREGHLWGRRDIAIPISAVVSMDDGVRLSMTKKQVDELPPRG